MIRVCNHDVGDSPELLCIVDDPFDGLDPVLVVQVGTSTDTTDAGNTTRFVEFVGDLDRYSANETEKVLMIVADAIDDVVVDLAGVAFCDCAGLRLIERFHDRVLANGRRVSIHASSRAVLRLITMLGIERFDLCTPVTSGHRSLRYDTTTSSALRVWQWDTPDDDIDPPGNDQQLMRLIELPGGREHPNRRRFTIDVTPTSPNSTTSDGEHHRPHARFILNGELDAEAAAISLTWVRHLDDFHDVTVELFGVTLMTSAGLRLIETAQQRVHARGGRFTVADPSLIVQRLLEIADVTFERSVPNDLHPNAAHPSARFTSTHRTEAAMPR